MPVIATNTAANTAVRYLNINASEQSDALAKLSSGSSITKASDNASGLAISTRIGADVASLQQDATNASNAVSILQIADGGASSISDILQRMKVLASNAASGTVTDTERTYINSEFSQLNKEIDTIAGSTSYDGSSLLQGSTSATGATLAASNSPATLTTGSAFKLTIGDGTTSVQVSATIAATGAGANNTMATLATAINTQLATAGVKAFATTDGNGNLKFESTDVAGTAPTSAAPTGSNAQVLIGEAAQAKITTAQGTNASSDTMTTSSGTSVGDAATTALGFASENASGTSAYTNSENWQGGVSVLVGTSATDAISISTSDLSSSGLGTSSLDVLTQADATSAMSTLDSAINTVSGARANIGAIMSRFQFQESAISTTQENLSAAKSAISDVDVASEEAQASADSVKVQAAVAASTQANQMPSALLKLMQ